MTTIDTIVEPARASESLIGRILARIVAVLRVIGEEIAYMAGEDSYHGRIERGVDDKY